MIYSGINQIDAILGEHSAIYMAGNNVVAYHFAEAPIAGMRAQATPNIPQQQAIIQALEYIGLITGIHFVPAGSSGAASMLTFTVGDLPEDYLGVAQPVGNTSFFIGIDTYTYEWMSDFSPGSDAYQVLLHELGHVLGLDHPFDGRYTLPAADDHAANTLMSYHWSESPRAYFSPYDLRALQWIYGGDGVAGMFGIGGTLGPSTGESYPAIVHTVAADVSRASEGGRTLTFTVTRTGNTALPSTVMWTASGTVDAADFGGVMPSGLVSFAEHQTERAITLHITDDTLVEEDEWVTVVLGSATGNGATVGQANSAKATITDNDLPPEVSIYPSTAQEGAAGQTTSMAFVLTRTGNLSGPTELIWTFSPFSTSADDFAQGRFPAEASLRFEPGESRKILVLQIAGDDRVEDDESFIINLSMTRFGTGGTTRAVGTILSDDFDSRFNISAHAASVTEGDSGTRSVEFTISRDGNHAASATVSWTRGGTANADDLAGGQPGAGELTFLPGETSRVLRLEILGDTLVERDESLVLTLTGVSGRGAGLGSTREASTVISSDDARHPVTVTAAQSSVLEGAAGSRTVHSFTLTRSGDLREATSIAWTTRGSLSPDEFLGAVLPHGEASFAAGAATTVLNITTLGDTLFESDELLVIALGEGDLLTADATRGSASVTLRNDDEPDEFRITTTTPLLTEGSAAGAKTSFRFELVRSGHVDTGASVQYTVTGSGANPTDAADFGSAYPAGTVKWSPGETRKALFITVQQDNLAEFDEGFTITLSNGIGADVSTTQFSASAVVKSDELPAPRTRVGTEAPNEKVTLPGPRAEFTLSHDAASQGVRVVDQDPGRSGTLTLRGVELLQFSDQVQLRLLPSAEQKSLLQLGQALRGPQGLDTGLYTLGLEVLPSLGLQALATEAATVFFGDLTAPQMAAAVLTNLGLTARALGAPGQGEATLQATEALLTSMFSGDAPARGQALLTAVQALAGLGGDASYGAAATAFNDRVATEWLAEFAALPASLTGLPDAWVELAGG